MVHMGNECSVANGTCPEHPSAQGIRSIDRKRPMPGIVYGVVSEFVARERKIIVDRLSHHQFSFFFFFFLSLSTLIVVALWPIVIHRIRFKNWIQMTSVFFFFFFVLASFYYGMIYIYIYM